MSAQPKPAGQAPETRRRVVINPTLEAAAPRAVVEPTDASAGLRQLLGVEAALRRAATREALTLALVNESAKLAQARQVFAIRLDGPAGPRVERVSGMASVERNAPLIRWIEGRVAALGEAGRRAPRALAASGDEAGEARTYPFSHALWLPLAERSGHVVGGLLLARERPWDDGDTALAARLAETGAHALLALRPSARPRVRGRLRNAAMVAAGLALAALAIPVPMTVLAPASITAERPFVIAAPIDGIVAEIAVAPNAAVAEGDPVVRYVDTAQRNAFAIAERDVQVAEARLRQLTQAAYTDDKARRELGQARAELALKAAERDFARETFARTLIRAERAGVAVYADRKDWFGKPVAAGQRILEIADPKTVEVRVDLPVADAIALQEGARVRVFLDSDPLNPLDATLAQVNPVARTTEAGILAHRVVAHLATAEGAAPRLGAHGTAQLYGASVPFGFYLLRKPLTWVRQKAGL